MTKLNGARILVTRPEHQADTLCQLITEQGGEAIRIPGLSIVAHEDSARIQKTLAELAKFQWLVFISANAVNFAVKANGGKIHHNSLLCLVAIGSATAKALHAAGLTVDLMPTTAQNSDALLVMPQMQDVAGQRFLIVRGSGGRETLADTLRARGAKVTYLEVYKRRMPQADNTQLRALLVTRQLAVVTATSVEILQNLLVMTGAGMRQYLLTTPLVVISERIRQAALAMGFEQVAVTEYPSDNAVLETVTTYVTGG
ncbi:uroporphyrinogen-III synthase [Crenothrix polyspora]|uniref:Uroporphyrinogen-III synthase n=1 Tax=Crenothrix polyspora TaxID=360316 RepID=A0A1R4HAV5_9GAMM|nr:uroporphyrinogen-III synthase [Crenothrix polyspora]SJM93317.1 Uroporphyrinogen III synthase HEM4 [Crenothrix polyspora]